MSQGEAFRYFSDKFGWGDTSLASYGNLERGSAEPDPQKAAAFLKEYGFDALPDEPTTSADDVELTLIAALAAQTEAINALVAEMKLARERDQDAAAAILMAAEALRPRPKQSGDEESTTLGVPRGSMG